MPKVEKHNKVIYADSHRSNMEQLNKTKYYFNRKFLNIKRRSISLIMKVGDKPITKFC